MQKYYQKGEVSLATLVVTGVVFVILVFAGFKFIPVFSERGIIKKAIEQTSAATYSSDSAAKQKFLGLLGNDSIKFDEQDCTLSAQPVGGGKYIIEFSWKKRVDLIAGKKMVLNFHEKTK